MKIGGWQTESFKVPRNLLFAVPSVLLGASVTGAPGLHIARRPQTYQVMWGVYYDCLAALSSEGRDTMLKVEASPLLSRHFKLQTIEAGTQMTAVFQLPLATALFY